MKLSPQEKAAHRAAFQVMSPGKKLEHIFTYYKAPILLTLLLLFVLGSRKKRSFSTWACSTSASARSWRKG